MRRWIGALAATALTMAAASAALASGDRSDGHRLAAVLDAMDVEGHWPAGAHVDWRSGDPDGRQEHFEGRHTHRSVFVAAAAERLGVYILRPPEHSQVLLANAQADWLRAHGPAYGWRPVSTGLQAQHEANLGYLVVASYKNHDAGRPGHIAIVRPSGRSRVDIEADGPEVIQAGGQNYNATTLRHGFAGHPAALGNQEVRYFEHDITGQDGATAAGSTPASAKGPASR